MTLLTAVFLLSCVAAGIGFTGFLPTPLRLEERVPIAAVIGAMAVTLAALVTIAVAGFSGATVTVAVVLAGLISAPGARRVAPSLAAEWHDAGRRLRLGWRHPDNPWPLVALCGLSWPLAVRILSLAYQPANGGIDAGHLSTYGDWQAHLAYAGRFAHGDGLDLTTPLAAGDDFAYHFGVDLFAALAVPTGVSLHAGLQVTSGYLAFALVPVLYLFGLRLFRRRSVAAGGSVLFLLAGGWGFTRFFDDVADRRAGRGWVATAGEVLWNQPQDYTRDFDRLYMDNPVLGHLYPQRPTLIGFAVVLIALAVLWSARTTGDRRAFAWVGVVVGLTPLFHTFGWGTSLVMGALWAATDAVAGRPWRPWLWFLAPAASLALPALWWLLPPQSSFRWHWGWVSDGSVGDLVDFWLLNTGLFPLLFVVALLWRPALGRPLAVALAPIWLWFAGVHVAVPHPWIGNNAKYVVFWWLLGSFAVAALLAAIVDRFGRRGSLGAVGIRGGVGAVALTLVAAGGLDVAQAAEGTSPSFPTAVNSAGDVLLGEWAQRNTDPDAVFVADTTSAAQPVPALGGRAVVSAFNGWVYDLGLDWFARAEASRAILAGGPDAERLIDRYGVDYVVIGPRELTEGASVDHWDRVGVLVYDLGGYRVYRPDR